MVAVGLLAQFGGLEGFGFLAQRIGHLQEFEGLLPEVATLLEERYDQAPTVIVRLCHTAPLESAPFTSPPARVRSGGVQAAMQRTVSPDFPHLRLFQRPSVWPAIGKDDGRSAPAPVFSLECALPRFEPLSKEFGVWESLGLSTAVRIGGHGHVFGRVVVVARFEPEGLLFAFEEPEHRGLIEWESRRRYRESAKRRKPTRDPENAWPHFPQ
jgi:hypothetical protein